MRRLTAAALVAAFGVLAVPAAEADVYAGSTAIATAATRVRGTDGVLYQFEVTVARHDLGGAKVDHELRIGLKTCGEPGCFGPVYTVPVAAKDVKFTSTTVTLSTTFAGTRVAVTWKARKPQGATTPGVPEASVADAAEVTVHRETRSAPATMVIGPALTCRTLTSQMRNQTGVVATVPAAASDTPPRTLPKGFFVSRTRKPRCF